MGNQIQSNYLFDPNSPHSIDDLNRSMRWFYCTESSNSKKSPHQREFKPFNFEVSFIIEQHFLANKIYTNEKDGIRIFPDYQNGEKHLMTKINDPWSKKEIIRQNIYQKPQKSFTVINDRFSKTFPVELNAHYENFPRAYSNQICLASYSKIFENVIYLQDDLFLNDFMNFTTLMDKSVYRYLQNDFNTIVIEQLKKYPYSSNSEILNLALNKVLTFQNLAEILTNNFQTSTKYDFKSYIQIFLKKLTKENFSETIIQMFKEEGKLYKAIMKMVKNKSYKHNHDLVLYYLCLLYALSSFTVKEQEKTFYIYLEEVNSVPFVKGNKYFLNEMLICRSEPLNPKSKIYKKSKLQIEIVYKNNSLTPVRFPFVCKHPYDLGNSEICKENEILLPHDIVLTCKGYLNERTVRFEMDVNVIENRIQNMNEREKNLFLIWEDVSYVSANCFQYEKEIYAKTKFTRFKQKNIKFAKKFENFSNTLESIECYAAEMTQNHLIHVLNIFNGKSPCKLQHLDLSGNEIGRDGLKELNRVLPKMAKTLTTLNLSFNLVNDDAIKELNFSYLQNLKYLILKENHLNPEGVIYLAKNFSYLKNLIVLDLYGNRIEDCGVEEIAKNIENLIHLGKIDLFNTFIEDKGIQELLPKLPMLYKTLRWVNLKHNLFGKEENVIKLFINVIEALDNIEYFNIEQNQFSDMDYCIIKEAFENKQNEIKKLTMDIYNYDMLKLNNKQSSKKQSVRNVSELKITTPQMFEYFVKNINKYSDNLKNLNFSEYDITQEIPLRCLKKFTSLDMCFKNLKILNFSYCSNLSSITFEVLLSNLSHFENLTVLNLDSIELNKKVKEFNKHLNQLCRIETLSLCYNSLDEIFIMETIEKFAYLISITSVDLYGNLLNCDAMKLFCMALKTQNNLTYLNLGNNLIGNEGVAYLGECFKYLNKLNYLDLSSNYIDDTSMRIFMTNYSYLLSMKKFDLRNNLVSQKTIDIILSQGVPEYFALK